MPERPAPPAGRTRFSRLFARRTLPKGSPDGLCPRKAGARKAVTGHVVHRRASTWRGNEGKTADAGLPRVTGPDMLHGQNIREIPFPGRGSAVSDGGPANILVLIFHVQRFAIKKTQTSRGPAQACPLPYGFCIRFMPRCGKGNPQSEAGSGVFRKGGSLPAPASRFSYISVCSVRAMTSFCRSRERSQK